MGGLEGCSKVVRKRPLPEFIEVLQKGDIIKPEEIKTKLLRSIDEVLDAVFGEETKDFFEGCIDAALNGRDVVSGSRRFSEQLEELLGTGARAIEVRIVQCFIQKIV